MLAGCSRISFRSRQEQRLIPRPTVDSHPLEWPLASLRRIRTCITGRGSSPFRCGPAHDCFCRTPDLPSSETILLPLRRSTIETASAPATAPFRGSITHPMQPLCTLRARPHHQHTQHSLPSRLLSVIWDGVTPTDRARLLKLGWPGAFLSPGYLANRKERAQAAMWRACNASPINAAPPNSILMPTRSPIAQAAVPGRPAMMTAASTRSTIPLASIRPHSPDSSRL